MQSQSECSFFMLCELEVNLTFVLDNVLRCLDLAKTLQAKHWRAEIIAGLRLDIFAAVGLEYLGDVSLVHKCLLTCNDELTSFKPPQLVACAVYNYKM